jgi:hypothetical protein
MRRWTWRLMACGGCRLSRLVATLPIQLSRLLAVGGYDSLLGRLAGGCIASWVVTLTCWICGFSVMLLAVLCWRPQIGYLCAVMLASILAITAHLALWLLLMLMNMSRLCSNGGCCAGFIGML